MLGPSAALIIECPPDSSTSASICLKIRLEKKKAANMMFEEIESDILDKEKFVV